MKVLVATEAQKNALDGYQNGQSRIEFILGAFGWFTAIENLSNPDLAEKHEELSALARADYVPESSD